MRALNPEFQRQLWLHCTASSVLWTLGLSVLLMAVPAALWGPRLVAGVALPALWCATVGYGGWLAVHSLRQELRQHTWDWQRLSALGPWDMAWGKWLGSTAVAWLYAACFATAGLLAQSLAWPGVVAPMALASIGQAVLWGAVVQLWAMNSVLLGWRGAHSSGMGARLGWGLGLLLMAAWPVRRLRRLWSDASGAESAVTWWGWDMSPLQLATLLGMGLLLLGLLALWRQLAQRLDVATLPWAWPAGLVGLALLVAGLFPVSAALVLSWVSCVALLATAGIALYAMPDGLVQWRQVQWHSHRRQWRGALQALPLWPVSWLLGMLAALAWMLLWPGDAARAPVAKAWLVALFGCQLLRDALLLTGFSLLAAKLRAPLAAFAVAWVVLNVLLPLLAVGGGGEAGRWLAVALQPLVTYASARGVGGMLAPGGYLGLMLLQVLVALLWCRWVFVRQVPVPRT